MIDNVPDPLEPVLHAIDGSPRTKLLTPWSQDSKQRWVLGFLAYLSVEPTAYMPAETAWYLVVENSIPRPKITIYPAVEGGITSTFPHQSANVSDSSNSLWRLGNPCVERPEAAFKRDEVTGEPTELSEKLLWKIGRLLSWIDAAATSTLLKPGDPLELPSFNITSTPVLGFTEKLGDLPGWCQQIGNWGFAKTGAISGASSHRQIVDFLSAEMKLLKNDVAIAVGDELPIDAIWIMLPDAPILEPWQSPRTWRELSSSLSLLEINLEEIFLQAGRQMRTSFKKSLNRLLLGFPLAERVGDEPERVHWIAAEQLGLSDNQTERKGFRPTERNRAYWDASKASSTDRVRWVKTSNWASDQLRTRGEAEATVRSSSVLIIGAGAIGSAVAENLARLGVCRIAVMDNDLLEVGNLSRHTLGISSCGHGKAEAVAKHLDDCAPDIKAEFFKADFPPSERPVVDAILKCDVIIDCTGSDSVLEGMADFDWKSEKVFISLSIGWGARTFFCFAASETSFPVIDALERFRKHIPFRPDVDTANREGIGCWHPVFPATADDIQLWSAIGAKFVRRAIVERRRQCAVYQMSSDGTVAVINE